MDSIFTKNERKFAEALFRVEHESTGVPVTLFLPNRSALQILITVFRYVKRQNKVGWTICNMIHQLAFIVNTGEYKYLYGEWIIQDRLFRSIKNRKSVEALQLVKDIQYAGRWLAFYYLTYELPQKRKKKNQNRNYNKNCNEISNKEYEKILELQEEEVRNEISRLNIAVTMWEDLRKNEIDIEIKKTEEKVKAAWAEKQRKKEEKKDENTEKVSNEACGQDFPVRLYEHLNKYVVGQENLKKTLSMAVYRYMKYGERNPLLIVGPTGSGKNYVMETLAKFEEIDQNMAVYTYDASGITMNGYKGNDISDILGSFKKICSAQGKPVTKGIIFLDEIDKIIAPNTDGNGENVNAAIQHQLLSVIAGTTTLSGVNTKDILFVLGGAFSKLEEMEKEKKKNAIGFGNEKETYDIIRQGDGTLRENLIAYGAQKEFLGRISNIVRIGRLKQDELKQILTHKETSILNKKKQHFLEEGLTLEFEDELIDLIAEKVYKENLGARSVTNIIEVLLGTYDFDMLVNGYTKMIVHAGMFAGETPIFEKDAKKEENLKTNEEEVKKAS